ncbi:hypothetical protein MPSEU_000950400 [Mayamaea pseudoterrestris]|nr:hypothetical protein MPSEU_000950400 [Mayamaea pseudoterrestris]
MTNDNPAKRNCSMARCIDFETGACSFAASTNLKREWRKCYLDAMGFELRDDEGDEDDDDTSERPKTDAKRSRTMFVNLVPPIENALPPSGSDTHKPVDAWTETALQVQNNVLEMAAWIQKKKWDYISVTMPDDEASLIASTVTSFIPTTANEIESLRQMTQTIQNHTQQQHKMGIVQILMVLLREHVADPFALLQKQRSRTAVALWQNPLQCRLVAPNAAVYQHDDDEDDDLDNALGISPSMTARERQQKQCFQPTRPAHLLQHGFLETYKDVGRRRQRPDSVLFSKRARRSTEILPVDERMNIPYASKTSTTMRQDVSVPPETNTNYYLSPETLQQESLLLAVNHDLDSVQLVEQRMVDITTLLSQFASLVTEQQEFVQDIYETTSDAKTNMDKGQEELIKAKETVKAGKHYTAKAIFVMGVLLLVLHWVVP